MNSRLCLGPWWLKLHVATRRSSFYPEGFQKSRSKLALSWAEDWLFPSLASETRRCICRTHCTIFFSADTKAVFQFHNGTFTIHLTLEWRHSSSFTAHSLPPCGLFTWARVQPILRLPCRKTLFDAMRWWGPVQETPAIGSVCLACRCVCFWCVYLSARLADSFTVPLKQNVQIGCNTDGS